jgi:hypothetical protein
VQLVPGPGRLAVQNVQAATTSSPRSAMRKSFNLAASAGAPASASTAPASTAEATPAAMILPRVPMEHHPLYRSFDSSDLHDRLARFVLRGGDRRPLNRLRRPAHDLVLAAQRLARVLQARQLPCQLVRVVREIHLPYPLSGTGA